MKRFELLGSEMFFLLLFNLTATGNNFPERVSVPLEMNSNSGVNYSPRDAGYQKALSGPVIIDASRYPTLKAAFEAVPEGGGLVIIPPGEYEITEPLVLTKDNTHVRGSGPSTHIINRNENGEPGLIVRSVNSSDKKTFLWRIQLSDFRVSGNGKSGDGIYLERINELFVSGLLVDHNGRHGINMNFCYENPRINHCNITYNAIAGIFAEGSHDVVMSANQFEENLDALQYINGFNLTMTGNNVDDHLRNGVVIENTYGSVISGNMIEECKGTAVILDRDCYGITVSSNVIADDGGGVELRDAWGCTISANTFVMVFNFSVLVGEKSGRAIISGNNFCNSYIGEGKIKRLEQDPAKTSPELGKDGGTGVILKGTTDIAITGNFFGGLTGEAVKADAACSRLMVTGNIMTELCRLSNDVKTAIDLGGAKESMVKDNTVEKGLIIK